MNECLIDTDILSYYMKGDSSGRIGISNGNPLTEFHIKDNDNDVALFLEPEGWNNRRGTAELSLGDRFHFIRAMFNQGMIINDFNQINFRTGGRNAESRMLIDFEGNVGIGTDEPAANLHTVGTVRLDDLPDGEGDVLTVDRAGNIGVSIIDTRLILLTLDSVLTVVNNQAEEIAELKSAIAQSKPTIETSLKAKLHQNKPNPFDQSTEIGFFLPNEVRQATLYIYNWQGKQIKKIDLNQRGDASIQIQAGTLEAGIYHYALMVDGKRTDVKEMMITD